MRLRECLCLRVSPSPAVFANTELVTEALWTASFTVFLEKQHFTMFTSSFAYTLLYVITRHVTCRISTCAFSFSVHTVRPRTDMHV